MDWNEADLLSLTVENPVIEPWRFRFGYSDPKPLTPGPYKHVISSGKFTALFRTTHEFSGRGDFRAELVIDLDIDGIAHNTAELRLNHWDVHLQTWEGIEFGGRPFVFYNGWDEVRRTLESELFQKLRKFYNGRKVVEFS